MKNYLLIFLSICVFSNLNAQLFGGQIKTSINLATQYPVGSVFCASGPTAIVEVTNPTTGKVWMDRNLGASQVATSSTDAAAYGDLYQWGRRSDGHQCRNSPTTNTLSTGLFNPNPDQPVDNKFILVQNAPFDWRSPQNNNLWQGLNGINNPCPIGFKLPTSSELNSEINTWSNNNAVGAFNSILKFTRCGFRRGNDGVLQNVGAGGDYYSSSVNNTNVMYLAYDGSIAFVGQSERSFGRAVRCIKN